MNTSIGLSFYIIAQLSYCIEITSRLERGISLRRRKQKTLAYGGQQIHFSSFCAVQAARRK